MFRQSLTEQLDHDPDFNWRGSQVTRIENLSDIVFALAFGMMVTASDVPFTFSGIKSYLVSLVPISIAFGFMLGMWNRHFLFFRRYGLADNHIVWLNALLLLTILSIAYPMRFIFESLFAWIVSLFGNSTLMSRIEVTNYREAGEIVAYFGAIYALLNFIEAQMYARASRKSAILQLNALEQAHTKSSIWTARWNVLLGLISASLAYYTVLGPFAGFLINLTAPAGFFTRRAILGPLSGKQSSASDVVEIDGGIANIEDE
ncbi:MAG: TMEM175 family protein [Pseudomonadota bacterium]